MKPPIDEYPGLEPGHNEGTAGYAEIKRETSKLIALRELRSLQKMVLKHALDEKLEAVLRPSFVRSYVEVRNQIRIEHGIIKPGSRNISVREEPKTKAIPNIDAAAMAEMREAAAAMGITPRVETEQTHAQATGTNG